MKDAQTAYAKELQTNSRLIGVEPGDPHAVVPAGLKLQQVDAEDLLPEVVRRFAGPEQYRLLPTLCWFDTSDRFLHGLALAGSLAAVSLACDVVPALGAAVAWASYLSLTLAARDFLAGMTDRYAVRLFEQLFIPKPWAIE